MKERTSLSTRQTIENKLQQEKCPKKLVLKSKQPGKGTLDFNIIHIQAIHGHYQSSTHHCHSI
jgi:hypothetical protein